MASLFLSHASADRPFVLRLSRSLEQLGHIVWVDAKEIHIGDIIPRRVALALELADFLVVVLSRQSIASSWVEHEWYAKYWDEVVSRQTMVLPVLVEECAIPLFLRPKRHADFRADYAVGLAQLGIVLHELSRVKPVPASNNHYTNGAGAIAQDCTVHSVVSSASPVCYTQDTVKQFGELVAVNVGLDIPYLGKIEGVWKPDEREQNAAWELYVELVTRIAVADIAPGEGLLRESLSSLYSMFTTTRQILRSYGPSIARPKGDSQLSFGYLAVSMLNYGLRPVLAKWHPLLLDYEHQRPALVSALAHEANWERAEELRGELNRVRAILLEYTNLLAEISRVPTTIPQNS